MTRLRLLKNNKGVTLVELIVALAISSVLLVAMVSASLFVQKFVTTWQQKDSLAEELAYIRDEMCPKLEGAYSVRLFSDSLRVTAKDRQAVVYSWSGGKLLKSGRSLLRTGFRLDSLCISKISLQNSESQNILAGEAVPVRAGLYTLFVKVSAHKGQQDSLQVVVRNEYEYHTY